MVSKISFTETIIYKMIQLQYSVDFTSFLHLMVLANRYCKGVGSTQTSIFSPNTVFHSLHYSQESLRHVCFLQFFYLCPATGLLHQSLKSSTRPGNRFLLGNYHHISFIRVTKSGVLTMLIRKICHNGLLHLLKILSEP